MPLCHSGAVDDKGERAGLFGVFELGEAVGFHGSRESEVIFLIENCAGYISQRSADVKYGRIDGVDTGPPFRQVSCSDIDVTACLEERSEYLLFKLERQVQETGSGSYYTWIVELRHAEHNVGRKYGFDIVARSATKGRSTRF